MIDLSGWEIVCTNGKTLAGRPRDEMADGSFTLEPCIQLHDGVHVVEDGNGNIGVAYQALFSPLYGSGVRSQKIPPGALRTKIENLADARSWRIKIASAIESHENIARGDSAIAMPRPRLVT